MGSSNDFFMRICEEAAAELASGDKSWKDVHPNTLLLAAFGMLNNHLTSGIIKPLWFAAGTIFTGTVGWLISIWL